MMYELSVYGRPWHDPNSVFPPPRDVYLHERDPTDSGARMSFLLHTKCPYATATRIIEWAKGLGIPVVFHPPECEAESWRPETQPAPPAPAPPVKPDSALDF